MNLSERVRRRLQRVPQGGVIASKTLHKLSTESQRVDKAVARLHETQGLKKLRNGLYFKPHVSPHFGTLPPREADVIHAVRQQYGAKIAPSGELAAFELGLTGTMPDAITYESDKRIGPIELENLSLRFNKVDGKKLSAAKPSLLALLKALEYLYKSAGHLSTLQRRRAQALLRDIPREQVKKSLPHWPRWLHERIDDLAPEASPIYITGLSALNIPHDGKQSDWHQMGMLHSNKFQVANRNYEGAPGVTDEELFDCSWFLDKFGVNAGTTLCATPSRAVKDILYANVIKKNHYPSFFMLDEFMIDIDMDDLNKIIAELKTLASPEQASILDGWARDNELH